MNRSLSIIIPALNEEKTVKSVVDNIENSCRKNNIDWEIILVDDGSSDKTGEIMKQFTKTNTRIKMLSHSNPLGIGKCFKDAIKIFGKEFVTWLPADGENKIEELLKYINLLEFVDIVIPFVINTGARNWLRRFLSSLYLFIINFSFGATFNYTNGNVLYKKKVFEVIETDSNGFFFQTECLIKAIRKGFIFAEVPVFLEERVASYSKSVSFKNLIQIIKDFTLLFIAVHILEITGKT